MTRFRIILTLFTLITALSLRSGQNEDHIIFLHVTYSPQNIEITNTRVLAGVLKKPKTVSCKAGDLLCVAKTITGRILFVQVVEDPLNPVFEYVDDQGQLQKKEVTKPSANLLFRIPYFHHLSILEFRVAGKAANSMRGMDSDSELIFTLDWN